MLRKLCLGCIAITTDSIRQMEQSQGRGCCNNCWWRKTIVALFNVVWTQQVRALLWLRLSVLDGSQVCGCLTEYAPMYALYGTKRRNVTSIEDVHALDDTVGFGFFCAKKISSLNMILAAPRVPFMLLLLLETGSELLTRCTSSCCIRRTSTVWSGTKSLNCQVE